MLKLVNGSKLLGTIRECKNATFWQPPRRHTEQEYLQFLLDSQEYIHGIADGSISPDDAYYIYAPDCYLEWGTASNIAVIRNDKIYGVDARCVHIDQAVQVKPFKNGYVIGYDGKHRFFIAQKYGLDLLVNVVER